VGCGWSSSCVREPTALARRCGVRARDFCAEQREQRRRADREQQRIPTKAAVAEHDAVCSGFDGRRDQCGCDHLRGRGASVDGRSPARVKRGAQDDDAAPAHRDGRGGPARGEMVGLRDYGAGRPPGRRPGRRSRGSSRDARAGLVKAHLLVAVVLGQVGVEHGDCPLGDVGPVCGQASDDRAGVQEAAGAWQRPQRVGAGPELEPSGDFPLRSGQLDSAPTKKVPLRMLIDRPSNGATSCRRFAAPHLRREGLVCFRPRHGQAAMALSRRRSRQQQDDL
jgi:hypothetical protein